MADHTQIEWADATWNPVVGCQVVSPGCTNCYAMDVAARLLDKPALHYEGTTRRVNGAAVWTGKVALAPEHILSQPLRWAKGRRIFVNSMGDLFAEQVPADWVALVFATAAVAQQHQFLVLTKRPERARELLTDSDFWSQVNGLAEVFAADFSDPTRRRRDDYLARTAEGCVATPLPNVWLGTSVEDQRRADERLPVLLDTPAAVRWVSAEPLLGPVDLTPWLRAIDHRATGLFDDPLAAFLLSDARQADPDSVSAPGLLHWVVAGGESGRDARPAHPDWFRALRDQCARADVPFFFKQWGEFGAAGAHVGKARSGRTLDGVTHDAFPRVP